MMMMIIMIIMTRYHDMSWPYKGNYVMFTAAAPAAAAVDDDDDQSQKDIALCCRR